MRSCITTEALLGAFPGAEVYRAPPVWQGQFWQRVDQERASRDAFRAASGPAPEAPGAAAGNLEEVSLDPHAPIRPDYHGDPEAWNFKVVTYSSGIVEATGFTGCSATRRPEKSSDGGTGRVLAQAATDSAERFASNIARTKRTCRARVQELDADSMITLTKRHKFATVDEVWDAFRQFSQSMKRRYGARWRYVAVPELHSDGETWHMHVAIKGFYWVGTLRRFWYRALGGAGDEQGELTPGSINVRFFKARNRAPIAGSVAGYIAKYVGKGVCGLSRNRRVFAASSGLLPLRIEKWHSAELWGYQETVSSLQRFLHGRGADARGSAWFFTRGRVSGFRLSTVDRGICNAQG